MYATILISVPTGVKVFNWVTTMWRGSMTFETPMLWAVAFVILFTIGGFSGLMLGIAPADIQYHDTYFVVAHFHYVLVTGALFSIIAAVFYWLPMWCGRMYNEKLAQIHFWWAVISVNVLFFPQHFLGLAGMPRRIPDYSLQFADFNMISSIGGFAFGLSFIMLTMGKSVEELQSMTEDELLKHQRKGARLTALIVAIIALGVFSLTLYMKSKAA